MNRDPGSGHGRPEDGQETIQDWRTINAFGRSVTLEVGDTIDGCGQFRVALLVDGKERYAAHFTDKSPDAS